ncbi:VCBS repeat-containing protein [candidate division KSB1 bacterium]|nr:VCBS repeat-containing protein [candidate division KSB1 bacterium]
MKKCLALLILILISFTCTSNHSDAPRFSITAKIEAGSITLSNTPCEAEIDFSAHLTAAGIDGELDRHSIKVEGKNPQSDSFESVDYRISEHFKYQSKGYVWWLAENPKMTEYRIWFDVNAEHPRQARDYIPAIGVGDELLYNTDEPVPLVSMSGNLVADYDGDGITDALSLNHYSERFSWADDGVFFYRGSEKSEKNIIVKYCCRLHTIPTATKDFGYEPLHARYNWIKPVDWDTDGLGDLLFVSIDRRTPFFFFYKNTGYLDRNSIPLLKETKRYPANEIIDNAYVPAVDAEDLDGDGRVDLVGIRTSPDGSMREVTVHFYRNIAADDSGVSELAAPQVLFTSEGKPVTGMNSAHTLSLGDVDDDGKIDIVGNNHYSDHPEVFWYRNLGGNPPLFESATSIEDLPADLRGYRWVRWDDHQGLMSGDENILFERAIEHGKPVFRAAGHLRQIRGPLVGGHQEKPEWVDWDDDGDFDLLAGEAWGRIHLYENIGTRQNPRFKAPVWIEANGKQIRIYRDGIFGGHHWHGAMGYPSVACMDWNRDGLFDLIVPNETNRVFWFPNIGEPGRPKFGPQHQILPDRYSDSPERREQTRLKTLDFVYPKETESPFYWRTRLAIADYTGDGLEDIICLNGVKNLVLYRRYRSQSGALRLKPGEQLYFEDGSPILEDGNKYIKLRNCDWDHDGLIDIIMTQNLFRGNKHSLFFIKNVGSKQQPVFAQPEIMKRWDEPIAYSSHGFQPSLIDWDADERLDFVGCSESGYFILLRNAVLTQPKPIIHLNPNL